MTETLFCKKCGKEAPLREFENTSRYGVYLRHNKTFCKKKPTPKRAIHVNKTLLYQNVTRPQVLLRDRYICQDCGNSGTEAHHIYGRGKYLNEVRLLITLCPKDHRIAQDTLKQSRPRHIQYLRKKYGYDYSDIPEAIQWVT